MAYGGVAGAQIIAGGGAKALGASKGIGQTGAALRIMGQNMTAHGLRGAGLGLQNATHMPMSAHMPLRGAGGAVSMLGNKLAMNSQEMQHFSAGTSAQAILNHHVTDNLQPVPSGVNYHESLNKMSDRELIDGLNTNYGMKLDLAHAGETRRYLNSLDDNRLGHVLLHPKKYTPEEVQTAHDNLLGNQAKLHDALKQTGKELYTPDWVVSARRRYFRKR